MQQNLKSNGILARQQKPGVLIQPGMSPVLQSVAQWLATYLFERTLPVNISFQQVERLYSLRSQESVKAAVNEFCLKWIPKLYGIPPESPHFRQACLCEFTRWHVAFGIPMSYSFARAQWYWGEKGKVPERLGILVGVADLVYGILHNFGIRIVYSIQIF